MTEKQVPGHFPNGHTGTPTKGLHPLKTPTLLQYHLYCDLDRGKKHPEREIWSIVIKKGKKVILPPWICNQAHKYAFKTS